MPKLLHPRPTTETLVRRPIRRFSIEARLYGARSRGFAGIVVAMTSPAAERSAPAADLSDALDRLRAHGGRVTSAKRALLAVFFASSDTLTVEQLASVMPAVDDSTLYRSLAQFEELGLVEHVHIGHGPAMYRRNGAGAVHIVCVVCGRAVDLPAGELRALAAHVRRDHAIELDLTHFSLMGRCLDCTAPHH